MRRLSARRLSSVVATAVTVAVVAGAVVAGGQPAGTPSGRLTLRGAGATFPAPLYEAWIKRFTAQHPDVSLVYDAVGSGEGQRRFLAQAVDFGASDAALSDEQIAAARAGASLVPVTAGMVVLAYNLPGLGGPLKLPRDVYVDLLLGKIASWDDPRIASANPDLKLPKRSIALVARLDKSGTTYALTSHLSAVSERWRNGPGAATWVEWPSQVMLARGNEGVASRIKISEGAIGYVEYGFAKRLGLTVAALQNKAGAFVLPDQGSAQSALAEGTVGASGDLRLFITDPAQPASYPVVTYSWLLLYKQYPDPQKRAALRDFVGWGLRKGQELGQPLGYIPLPANVAAQAQSALRAID